jgi:hypothetical protein
VTITSSFGPFAEPRTASSYPAFSFCPARRACPALGRSSRRCFPLRNNGSERGLLGVAPHPDFASTQFGGPAPDNAHFTGVIIRLNEDGSAPADNPFFTVGQRKGGEEGANLQKIFAYGVRNSFGLAFDPLSGHLWDEQNGDDSFDELNLVEPGSNLGWVQIMGPAAQIADFKTIETTLSPFDLQQQRWPPTNIADSAAGRSARNTKAICSSARRGRLFRMDMCSVSI